jgi:flagellar basal-body rod modification protein FlgD
MTTTTALPTSSTTATQTVATQDASGANGTLGKDDFLKLFVAQLQHQDPLNPMEDKEFMGQMASFSTLEQVTKLATANEQLASSLSVTGSLGFIGRTVSYADAAGQTTTGVVQRVSTTNGTVSLTVDGVDGVDPKTITQVA